MFRSAKDFLSSPNPCVSRNENSEEEDQKLLEAANRITSASPCIMSPGGALPSRNREITISQYRPLKQEDKIIVSSKVKTAISENASVSRTREISDYKRDKEETQGKSLEYE